MLKFHPSYKMYWSMLSMSSRKYYGTDEVNFDRYGTYLSKDGTVKILEWQWENNNGINASTEFETVWNGRKYSATLNQVDLSDRQLKVWSAKFLKGIKL